MNSSLSPFENYVTSLTNLGVYPTFNRNYNGWTCVLRNGVNTKIMPFSDDQCWGETMIDALTVAVDGLNKRFSDPNDLHRYINTGISQNIETLLESIESLYLVKTEINDADFGHLNNETIFEELLH